MFDFTNNFFLGHWLDVMLGAQKNKQMIGQDFESSNQNATIR